MLRDLSIQNYRCFKDFYIDGLARVNLIVGMNNSGKTSLLETIYLLVNQGAPQCLADLLYNRGEVVERVTLGVPGKLENYQIDYQVKYLYLTAQWQAVRDRLITSGYQNMPKVPPNDGWVDAPLDRPRVGVWLMPDNQLPGMLEDFVARLMPPEDTLRPKAEAVLQEIELAGLNCYTSVHRPKALIHTWLAWQETPGMPMGQAITAQVLRYDCAIALTFVKWLQRLFELPTTTG